VPIPWSEVNGLVAVLGDNYRMTQPSTLKTFLWFNNGMQDALKFYKATFGEAMRIDQSHLTNDSLFTADFTIYGHEFIGMNTPGGDTFNNSISLSLNVDGQEETDRLWEAITTDGAPGRCGWCTDAWGVSWQVSPFQMRDFLGHPDGAKAQQNWGILREMTKIQLSDFVQ
jgi:predicted 3-demethylubiquinone-9 3-methyltransferase (glyoxalase superfamily)